MPVYYFIQPDLPEHIKELTLSYTFYRDPNANALALSAAGDEDSSREE
jgi:cytochrome c oxidase assembly protein Cox11